MYLKSIYLFIQLTIICDPKERKTANELLNSRWLNDSSRTEIDEILDD